jgi:hypothetical protein
MKTNSHFETKPFFKIIHFSISSYFLFIRLVFFSKYQKKDKEAAVAETKKSQNSIFFLSCIITIFISI